MSIKTETVLHDRAMTIRTKKDIEEFLSDPKAFLTTRGALAGLSAFNGVKWVDGSKGLSKAEREKIDRLVIFCGHLPIPYRQYCEWWCFKHFE